MWVYVLKAYDDIIWAQVEKGRARVALLIELRDGYDNLEHQTFSDFLGIANEALKLLLFDKVWVPPTS